MHVETAICTWNRAALLDQTLRMLRSVDIPDGIDWHVLVVNNNCTDDTDEVIKCHRDHLPIKRLFEPQPGLSNARNCAVSAAEGELLLWTDDDVLVRRDWLAKYVRAAKEAPNASFFGGPIDPWFEVPAPQWLTNSLSDVAGALALLDWGETPFVIGEHNLHQLPYGANYAIRTAVQRQFRYDPSLGRREKLMLSGEESALLGEMVDAGHHGVWVPDSRVRHFVARERMKWEYVRDYFVGSGRTLVKIQDRHRRRSAAWTWTQAMAAELRGRWQAWTGHSRQSVQTTVHASYLWGQYVERRERANAARHVT